MIEDRDLADMEHQEMIELLSAYALEEDRRGAQADDDEAFHIHLFRAEFLREVRERIFRLSELEL